jgi:tetratricopeptide (TPR) repeat protein
LSNASIQISKERKRHLPALILKTIVVPVVALLCLEAALRLFNYGYPSQFTVPCTVGGKRAFCDNDRFTWQFFPAGAFRLPPTFAIPAEKGPTTFRIFVIGESAAQGDPEPAYGFARYLEVMLRERFPAGNFEIINTAITAINSHVLLPAVRDLAKQNGDLFLLYMGNNEVVGPFGPENPLSAHGASLRIIRLGIFLRSTRLWQLLDGAIESAWKDDAPNGWRGMEMFLDHQVPADAPALAQVYENFRSNLRDIVAVARGSGARVLVSTVAVNLRDSAPFASLHRTDLAPEELKAWEERVREGAAFELASRQGQALERYLSAAAIDDRHAELQYRIGRAYFTLGEFAAAARRFEAARDLDVLRFRIDSQTNDIIRSVADTAGPGVELLDAEKLFAELSPSGVPGRELFYDHVHMNPHGSYSLARALFPSVVALLPEGVRRSAATVEPPSEEEAEQLLALTAHDERRVARTVIAWLSQPPFTGRLDNDEQVQALRRDAEGSEDPEGTAEAYRLAIARAPDDRWLHFNYGLFLEPNQPAAAYEYRKALDVLPGDYAARDKLATALVRSGKFAEGIAQCRELLRRMPYDAPEYLTMAYAQARLGSFEESIAAYERAIELHPDYALDAYMNIGIIQLHQGTFDRAAASFEKAIEADSGHVRTAELRYNLNYALQRLGRQPPKTEGVP